MATRRYKSEAQPSLQVEGLVADTWVPGRIGEHLDYVTTGCGEVQRQHRIRISSRRLGGVGLAEALASLLRSFGYTRVNIIK